MIVVGEQQFLHSHTSKLRKAKVVSRAPLVIKTPGTSNQTAPEIIAAFEHVNDMTPTMMEYAGVNIPVRHIMVMNTSNYGKITKTIT